MTKIRLLSLALLILHNSTANAEKVVVYTELLPPFQYINSDKVAGAATEKVKHILKSAELDFDLHIVPWARAFNIVKTTPNTLIYSINRTPEREPYFYWIAVIAKIGNSFISLKSNEIRINSLEEAKAYVTAVVREGYAHGILLEQGFVSDKNMYVVATLEQQISLLLKGKIDFLFTDIETVRHSLSQQKIDPNHVHIAYSEAAWTRDLYLAANSDTDPQILNKINAKYSQISAKGSP